MSLNFSVYRMHVLRVERHLSLVLKVVLGSSLGRQEEKADKGQRAYGVEKNDVSFMRTPRLFYPEYRLYLMPIT